MHEAFANCDLVKEIVPYLEKGSLAALGCTCKVLSDPALDELWRDMVSLDPLYQCLPAGAWVKDANGRLVCLRNVLRYAPASL